MKKRKFDIETEDLVLRVPLAIFTVLAMIAFFFPGEDGKLRNLPLLCVILGIFLFFFIRKFILLVKVKSLFAKNGVENIRIHANPFSSFLRGSYSFSCSYKGAHYSVSVITRKNPWTSYHFETNEKIELYKTSCSMARADGRGRVARGEGYTRRIGVHKLKWYKPYNRTEPHKLVVFNKMPFSVTSSLQNGTFISGMEVLDDMFIYSYNSIKTDISTFLNRK